jgi:hypothetical protein
MISDRRRTLRFCAEDRARVKTSLGGGIGRVANRDEWMPGLK